MLTSNILQTCCERCDIIGKENGTVKGSWASPASLKLQVPSGQAPKKKSHDNKRWVCCKPRTGAVPEEMNAGLARKEGTKRCSAESPKLGRHTRSTGLCSSQHLADALKLCPGLRIIIPHLQHGIPRGFILQTKLDVNCFLQLKIKLHKLVSYNNGSFCAHGAKENNSWASKQNKGSMFSDSKAISNKLSSSVPHQTSKLYLECPFLKCPS